MQDLIDRAAMHEDTDVEALRDLATTISVEGIEPTPRLMTDGGVTTAGDVDLLLARDPVLWRHWTDLEDEVDR